MDAYHDRQGQMAIVLHHIYEYKKGVRNLVLCTLCSTCAEIIKERLDNQGIRYLVQKLGDRKVNLFFGAGPCLEAVKSFIHKPLNMLTPEEDYILGTMLGYDIAMQCKRFCEKKSNTGRLLN